MITNSNPFLPTQQMSVGTVSYHSPAAPIAELGTFSSKAPPVELMKKQKFELSIADEAVVHVLEKINRQLAGIPREVEYNFHRQDGQVVIKIINSETKEVLKEIPPEKILDMLAKFQEINRSAGAIIDEKR
ncbi:flagellar protein FlaG [Cohnella kolymensis]|uniref:flagellar protein FlaG n=1 Tax=Cohnella kolymensis TaxID=1590652 RepID=UPI0006977D90|nr:flagellar protein FlaG [Cohnella kolymensis]